jgi:protein SCO1
MPTDTLTRHARSARVQRVLPWVLLGLLLMSAGTLAIWPSACGVMPWMTAWRRGSGAGETSLERLDHYGQVPDFSLLECSGRPMTRVDLLGKVWVADFMYTECPDTCPLQSAQMARLHADFAGESDLRLVSISVDPGHDTPQVLAAYAARFQADPDRWLFLTGSKDAIDRLALEGFHLGVVDRGEHAQRGMGTGGAWLRSVSAWAHPVPNAERQPILHSPRFALVDRQAQIRGYYEGTDGAPLERLRKNLKIVLREQSRER